MRLYVFIPFLLLISLTLFKCAAPDAEKTPEANLIIKPIYVQSAILSVTLIRSAESGSQGSLIKEPGWRDYVLDIENLGTNSLTILNVKLLNQEGRYVDSAGSYDQITAPPDIGAEVAGDVAWTTAGIAAGQIIPYGGTILGLFSGTISALSSGEKAKAKNTFSSYVLKNVELAPAGKIEGHTFLPDIESPKALVVDYTYDVIRDRIEIPLIIQEP